MPLLLPSSLCHSSGSPAWPQLMKWRSSDVGNLCTYTQESYMHFSFLSTAFLSLSFSLCFCSSALHSSLSLSLSLSVSFYPCSIFVSSHSRGLFYLVLCPYWHVQHNIPFLSFLSFSFLSFSLFSLLSFIIVSYVLSFCHFFCCFCSFLYFPSNFFPSLVSPFLPFPTKARQPLFRVVIARFVLIWLYFLL